MVMGTMDGLLYGLSSLFSVFTQGLVLFFIFFISWLIVEKVRFFLLGFFWKKRGFDAVAKAVFGFFYLFMFTALIDVLFVLLLQWKAPFILSATAVKVNIALLTLMVVISYLRDALKDHISAKNPEASISSVLDLEIKEMEDEMGDSEYILYFNGSRVRNFETKEELLDFLQSVKNYLDIEVYEEALNFLGKNLS
jgi:hypothetical protein